MSKYDVGFELRLDQLLELTKPKPRKRPRVPVGTKVSTARWTGEIGPSGKVIGKTYKGGKARGAREQIKTRKGIYYFPTFQTAREWAQENGWPTDRIIAYQVGWAVQSGESGNYAGPGEVPTPFRGGGKARLAAGERGPRGGRTDIQALLFPLAAGWTEASARTWARAHGFNYGKVHTKGNHIRLRQAAPGRYRRMRTICFDEACRVKAIVGVR